jgi:hypothetical protein
MDLISLTSSRTIPITSIGRERRGKVFDYIIKINGIDYKIYRLLGDRFYLYFYGYISGSRINIHFAYLYFLVMKIYISVIGNT